MITFDRKAHWATVYTSKDETRTSWFEDNLIISVELIGATSVGAKASIIDIGGGASRLIDALLKLGFDALTIPDLSDAALATAKTRLGNVVQP
jgi:hypothetical protein